MYLLQRRVLHRKVQFGPTAMTRDILRAMNGGGLDVSKVSR
jgi:hypothetical protein